MQLALWKKDVIQFRTRICFYDTILNISDKVQKRDKFYWNARSSEEVLLKRYRIYGVEPFYVYH